MTFALYCVFRPRKRSAVKKTMKVSIRSTLDREEYVDMGGRVNDIAMHATGEMCIYP